MNPTQTYTQGNQFYSPQTGQAQGTVNFNPNTGQQLGTGQTVALTPALQAAAIAASRTPINGAALGATTTPVIPPPVNNTNATNNLQTRVDTAFTGNQVQNKDGSVSTTYSDGSTNVPLTPENQRQGFAQQLKDVFSKLGTKGARTNEINQEEGVNQKQTELRNIETEAMALDKSFQKRIDGLLGNGALTREQASPQVAELQRMQNSQKADLAIRQRVAQGNYTDAFNIAKAKVDAEFEPLQNQVDSLKAQIDLFQNDMTDSQKMKAEQAYQTQRDALDFQKQKELAAINHKYGLSEIYARNSADGSSNGTLNGKPQNATQSAAQSYATRLGEANLTLDDLAGKFTGAGTAISNTLGGLVPNFLKGGDRQAVEQAQKNFVTAILRRESGASISPTEFSTAADIYFPQPGDTASTVAQKALTRNTAINNMYHEANIARPVLPGQIIEANGKRYKVGADGNSLTEI